MIYTRFSADSRSSLTKTSAQPSPLLATCTFAIRTSRSLRYLVTPKLVLTHTNYGKAAFTQSEFQLHALSEVSGTPKMVLSNIKYGKAGCDREITSRLGGIDRDITNLSAHALIGHCLGNSPKSRSEQDNDHGLDLRAAKTPGCSSKTFSLPSALRLAVLATDVASDKDRG